MFLFLLFVCLFACLVWFGFFFQPSLNVLGFLAVFPRNLCWGRGVWVGRWGGGR